MFESFRVQARAAHEARPASLEHRRWQGASDGPVFSVLIFHLPFTRRQTAEY